MSTLGLHEDGTGHSHLYSYNHGISDNYALAGAEKFNLSDVEVWL